MNQKLIALHSKIEKLIHLHQQTLTENKKLVELNQSLQLKIEDQNSVLHQLDEKIKTVKLAQVISGVEPSENNSELKVKINTYIKEIDKCLTLLNH